MMPAGNIHDSIAHGKEDTGFEGLGEEVGKIVDGGDEGRMGLTQAHAHRIGERSRASHPRELVDHRPNSAVRTRKWAAQSCPEPTQLRFSTTCVDREYESHQTTLLLRRMINA